VTSADSSPCHRISGLKLYPEILPEENMPFEEPLHLAIGMFDGVHLGHQAVIGQAVQTTQVDAGSRSGVLTFDPHPSRVLHLEHATELLMSLPDRIGRMLSLGLDTVFVQTFTADYAQIGASSFISNLKTTFRGLKSLHVGANFRFGEGRSGSVDTMREYAAEAGLEVHVLERRISEGEAISSSRIRRDLAAGEIRRANTMLGYPYHISGEIQEGKRLGRRLGYPTLNIPWFPEARPRSGVYKAWLLSGPDGIPMPGVANYGFRPTVGSGSDPLLELHLHDPECIPPVGRFVKVALTHFLRPEKTFPSIDDLRDQISLDVEQARAISDEKVDFSRIGT